MKVVIIEDEQNAYKQLSKQIKAVFTNSIITAHLDSVQSAKDWFAHNSMPDIVFIDINLGDGSGFDVLNTVKIDCPFVFTTAYDQYAIEAFQTNSIAYLLKPVTKEDLEGVIKKLEGYQKMFSDSETVSILQKPAEPVSYKTRFIIRYGDRMKTLSVDEIAYCYSLNRATFVRTFDNKTYPLDYTLDVLEEMLDPHVFFRVNRQYLICIKAIEEMRAYSRARILLTLRPPASEAQMVSTERSAEFKHWLGE